MITCKYFDQENYWLIVTYELHKPELNDSELGYFVCDLIQRSIYFGGKMNSSYDTYPGREWSFEQFLFALQAPIEQVPWDDRGLRDNKYRCHLFSWFVPILEKLTKGNLVSYDEANAIFQIAYPGKNLRLYPVPNIGGDYRNKYMEQQDYNY